MNVCMHKPTRDKSWEQQKDVLRESVGGCEIIEWYYFTVEWVSQWHQLKGTPEKLNCMTLLCMKGPIRMIYLLTKGARMPSWIILTHLNLWWQGRKDIPHQLSRSWCQEPNLQLKKACGKPDSWGRSNPVLMKGHIERLSSFVWSNAHQLQWGLHLGATSQEFASIFVCLA